MIAAISVLLVVIVSMIVIRVAIVALIHTGMGREEARFQARSAFTGAGFTTSESESIVSPAGSLLSGAWLRLRAAGLNPSSSTRNVVDVRLI